MIVTTKQLVEANCHGNGTNDYIRVEQEYICLQLTMTRMGCGSSAHNAIKAFTNNESGVVAKLSNRSNGTLVKGPSEKQSLYSKKVPVSDLAFLEHRVDPDIESVNPTTSAETVPQPVDDDPYKMYRKSEIENRRILKAASGTNLPSQSSAKAHHKEEFKESPRIIRHRRKSMESKPSTGSNGLLPSQVQDPVALWPAHKKSPRPGSSRLSLPNDDSSSSSSTYSDESSFILVKKQVRVAWDSAVGQRGGMSTQETILSSTSSTSSSSSTTSSVVSPRKKTKHASKVMTINIKPADERKPDDTSSNNEESLIKLATPKQKAHTLPKITYLN